MFKSRGTTLVRNCFRTLRTSSNVLPMITGASVSALSAEPLRGSVQVLRSTVSQQPAALSRQLGTLLFLIYAFQLNCGYILSDTSSYVNTFSYHLFLCSAIICNSVIYTVPRAAFLLQSFQMDCFPFLYPGYNPIHKNTKKYKKHTLCQFIVNLV